MVFANIEDKRKPLLSLLFAIISLSTASFVYLSVDGTNAIHQCHNMSLGGAKSSTGNVTTTAAPGGKMQVGAGNEEPAVFDTIVRVDATATTNTKGGSTTQPGTTTAASPEFKIVEVDKYLAAVTGGIVIMSALSLCSIVVVLAVYCRSGNVLKVSFGIFVVLILALMYPLVVFGEALGEGESSGCREVGLRLVPSSVCLVVVGIFASLFFSDTLGKIRIGDDAAARSLLPQ
jgi:hypothetical protein